MTDDIVTRLRDLLDGPVPTTVVCLIRDAANEIEWLRQESDKRRRLLEAANYEVARLAIDLRDCRRGATRG